MPPFLRLPPEIRNRILYEATPRINVLISFIGFNGNFSTGKLVHRRACSATSVNDRACTNILLTCRQMYEEASGLLYEKTTFTFESMSAFVQFSRRTPLPSIRAISKLSFVRYFDILDFEGAFALGVSLEETWAMLYRNYLPSYQGLQQIQFHAVFEHANLTFGVGSIEKAWSDAWRHNCPRNISLVDVSIVCSSKSDGKTIDRLNKVARELANSMMTIEDQERRDTQEAIAAVERLAFAERDLRVLVISRETVAESKRTTVKTRSVQDGLLQAYGSRSESGKGRINYYNDEGRWIGSTTNFGA